jgi:hypothetical protein
MGMDGRDRFATEQQGARDYEERFIAPFLVRLLWLEVAGLILENGLSYFTDWSNISLQNVREDFGLNLDFRFGERNAVGLLDPGEDWILQSLCRYCFSEGAPDHVDFSRNRIKPRRRLV